MSSRLILLLIGLLLHTPFTSASVLEAWTEGLYDAEWYDIDQAVRSDEAAIECTPVVPAGFLPVFVRLAPIGDGPAPPALIQSARPSRAPPAS